jgi:signal transduction histidine kinase
MVASDSLFAMADPEQPAANISSDERVARRAVAGALAAELGHDLQGPLNLFRLMTDRLERGQALDAEDAALLREELGRLSGLSARLRELGRVPLSRGLHTPRQLVELALALAPALPASGGPGFRHELGGSEALSVSCDGALLARAIRELLDNALEARHERAGARWESAHGPCLVVWDDGEGFSVDPGKAARFGNTTRVGAAGLGLSVALRAARAHGLRLEFARTEGLTEVRLWFVAPSGGARY